MAFMTLKDIDVCYDKKKQVLKGLNLEVEEGELVSLLGPAAAARRRRSGWWPDLLNRRAESSLWMERI